METVYGGEYLAAVPFLLGVAAYLALLLAQDGRARRALVDFILAVNALFTDGTPRDQTAG